MKLAVKSVEVATLKADGKPWDGPGRARVPAAELGAFFALDLDGQLGRLVTAGEAPPPPDLFVRVYAGDELVIETADEKAFDAEWGADDTMESAELEAGTVIVVEVWDRDVLFHDLIGRVELRVPGEPRAAWDVGAFGQVRRLVLRLS